MLLDGYSDHIVYADESGDHGLAQMDAKHPIFVLAFCVCSKAGYAHRLVPSFKTFKFEQFGHDMVVLHEHAIRKRLGAFSFPDNRRYHDFVDALTSIVVAGDFSIIAAAIDKRRLVASASAIPNPYHLALEACLEALYERALAKQQAGLVTHVVVECRGPKEDRELEAVFETVCSGANRWRRPLPFVVVFADKKSNSAGLQLADLVARPIGLSVLRPDGKNRAFAALRDKIHRLDLLPQPDNKRPR